MPYTRKQVKLFLSSASPLTPLQQDKVKAELHADPSMGHAKKGSAALKRGSTKKRGSAPRVENETHAYDWRQQQGRPPAAKKDKS